MINVLSKLEQIRAKLMYAVVVGHGFIPVTRLMLLVNRISKILGHHRPVSYEHPYSQDPPQRKVYDALDLAHQELFDLLSSRAEVIDKVGEREYDDLASMMADLSNAKDKAYDKEHGPGSSLLKRGRKFSQLSRTWPQAG